MMAEANSAIKRLLSTARAGRYGEQQKSVIGDTVVLHVGLDDATALLMGRSRISHQ